MKTKSIIVFILGAFALLSLSVSISSCKDENCSEYHIRELNKDTTQILYVGYETLQFIIEDSLGNFLDSATFIGEGKRKYVMGSDRKMLSCGDILHDHRNMDITYLNTDDEKEKLILTFKKEEYDTKFSVILLSKRGNAAYRGFISYFFNSTITAYHDVINIKNKQYFKVIQFTSGGWNYNSAYFGRYDGILSIEETPNRIWYKVN